MDRERLERAALAMFHRRLYESHGGRTFSEMASECVTRAQVLLAAVDAACPEPQISEPDWAKHVGTATWEMAQDRARMFAQMSPCERALRVPEVRALVEEAVRLCVAYPDRYLTLEERLKPFREVE